MFNPHDYIQVIDHNVVLCINPVPDRGMSSITVTLGLTGEGKRHFDNSIRRMVLEKLFSPKFAEVILSASDMKVEEAQHLQMA